MDPRLMALMAQYQQQSRAVPASDPNSDPTIEQLVEQAQQNGDGGVNYGIPSWGTENQLAQRDPVGDWLGSVGGFFNDTANNWQTGVDHIANDMQAPESAQAWNVGRNALSMSLLPLLTGIQNLDGHEGGWTFADSLKGAGMQPAGGPPAQAAPRGPVSPRKGAPPVQAPQPPAAPKRGSGPIAW